MAHPCSPSPPGGSDLPLGRAARPYYVVGVDTSSARLAVSLPGAKTFVLDADGDPDVRRRVLFRGARDLFATLPPGSWVFAEEPLALQNGKTTRLLGLAAGAIWAAHVGFDLWWSWVDVANWKREVIGKGNAKKEDIRVWVEDNPAFQHEDRAEFLAYPDLYDAFAIRIHGVRLCRALT